MPKSPKPGPPEHPDAFVSVRWNVVVISECAQLELDAEDCDHLAAFLTQAAIWLRAHKPEKK